MFSQKNPYENHSEQLFYQLKNCFQTTGGSSALTVACLSLGKLVTVGCYDGGKKTAWVL